MKLSNFLLMCLCVLVLASCKSNEQPSEEMSAKKVSHDDTSLPFDQRVKKYVEGSIGIPADEKYSLKTYTEHLNDDGVEDVIITINRLDNAINSAIAKGKVNKSAQLDFFGEHNYFVYYSSKSNSFSAPIKMASSPYRELKVSFENISSINHKDVIIDYAIRNSQFKKIFLFIKDTPTYAFHWNIYDGWGTDEVVAHCFEFKKGSYTEVKDIVINRAVLKNIGPEDDYNTIEPEIECTDVLVKRFFYNDQDGKYYTPN